ncbi:alpha/beta fold hydrolase [Streptosporangium lutulentum]
MRGTRTRGADDVGAIRKLMAGDVPIVAEDHGGHGRDVLLLHGGGRTREDWEVFAGLLVDDGFRPVSMDLRGHGESGQAPWSWREALADVAAVVTEYELRRPVIVGHSLGGMVAALWAGEHPECPSRSTSTGTATRRGLTSSSAWTRTRRNVPAGRWVRSWPRWGGGSPSRSSTSCVR